MYIVHVHAYNLFIVIHDMYMYRLGTEKEALSCLSKCISLCHRTSSLPSGLNRLYIYDRMYVMTMYMHPHATPKT